MTDQRLWTKTFIIGIVVNLFMSTVFYLLMTTMAVYAVDRFAASDAGAGLASSGFIIGAVVGRVLAGKYLDVVGRRRTLVLSMAVFVVAGIAYIPADGLGLLIAVRLVHGLAFGLGNTALVASIQSVIPSARRAEGNGYFGTATTLATAVGPFLGVTLAAEYGFSTLFWVCSGCGLLAMLAGLAYTVPERVLTDDDRKRLKSFRPSSFIDAKALPYAAVMGFGGLAYSSVLAYLAGYTASLSVPQAASVFFLLYAAGSLVARLFAGRIQDVYGDNVVLVPVFAVFAGGMAIIAMADSVGGFALAGLLTGLGFGCLLPSMQAILISRTSPAEVGVATSTFFLVLDVGTGLGPVFLGAFAGLVSYTAMFWLSAGFVLVSAAVYAAVHGLRSGWGRRL